MNKALNKFYYLDMHHPAVLVQGIHSYDTR